MLLILICFLNRPYRSRRSVNLRLWSPLCRHHLAFTNFPLYGQLDYRSSSRFFIFFCSVSNQSSRSLTFAIPRLALVKYAPSTISDIFFLFLLFYLPLLFFLLSVCTVIDSPLPRSICYCIFLPFHISTKIPSPQSGLFASLQLAIFIPPDSLLSVQNIEMTIKKNSLLMIPSDITVLLGGPCFRTITIAIGQRATAFHAMIKKSQLE